MDSTRNNAKLILPVQWNTLTSFKFSIALFKNPILGSSIGHWPLLTKKKDWFPTLKKGS